jgi:hypothetical protein
MRLYVCNLDKIKAYYYLHGLPEESWIGCIVWGGHELDDSPLLSFSFMSEKGKLHSIALILEQD